MSDVDEAAETPHVAGMYDCYLGGTANTAADRAAVRKMREALPDVIDAAWANRGFLQRSAKRMAQEWGIRQFLDIGAGLPTQRHVHEVVAEAVPDGRVVYVDKDERVIERGRELLAGIDNVTAFEGDIRDVDGVLNRPELRRLINLDEPVGLLLVAVTQFIPDADDPWDVVGRYLKAMAPGSYLALSAPTTENQAPHVVDAAVKVYAATPTPHTLRSKADIARFFAGLSIVPPYPGAAPSVTYVGEWGAEDATAADSDGSRWFYAAVARKP
jgi:hypothetical protein